MRGGDTVLHYCREPGAAGGEPESGFEMYQAEREPKEEYERVWEFRCLHCLLIIVPAMYVLLIPFTKVEESFNIQATHDILYHGTRLYKYDHNDFPGPVPRTFLGPLFLAASSWPLHYVFVKLAEHEIIFSPPASWTKLPSQFAVRLTLSLVGSLSLIYLCTCVRRILGAKTAIVFALISLAQFHFLFYIGRTLPNSFAMILMNFAYGSWFCGKWKQSTALLIFTTAVFRCELALIALPIFFVKLYLNPRAIHSLYKTALSASVLSVALTVLVDSHMWQRLCYPEWEVFYFNAIRGQSRLWGTSPWHWYFLSALPRMCVVALPLAAVGLLWHRQSWRILLPAVAYVTLYSFQAHKELRFVLYVVPLINTIAAVGVVQAKRRARFNDIALAINLLQHAGYALCLAIIPVFFMAAYWNYPGGHALMRLYEKAESDNHGVSACDPWRPVSVYVDNTACQSGFTRFLELRNCPSWIYSKGLEPYEELLRLSNFTYIVSERIEWPANAPKNERRPRPTRLAVVHAFERIDVDIDHMKHALKWSELKLFKIPLIALKPALSVWRP